MVIKLENMKFLEQFKRRVESSSDEVEIVYRYSIAIDQLKLLGSAIKFSDHPDADRDAVNKEVRNALISTINDGIDDLENLIYRHLDMKTRYAKAKAGDVIIDESAVGEREPARKERTSVSPSPKPKLSFNFKRK